MYTNIRRGIPGFVACADFSTMVVAGVSAAMNELRPCCPISLKLIIAQELIKGLREVAESLLRYNATQILRENESSLFLSLCRAFIEVLHSSIHPPHCSKITFCTFAI